MEKRRLLEFRKPRTGKLITFGTKQYYVTDTGQVWNEARKMYLKQYEMNRGYMVVGLRDDNGKRHSGLCVHNLVANCFLHLLQKGENVHHRNHDKKDNRLNNLEIIDGGEHLRMHWKDGTYDGLKNGTSMPAKAVAQIDMYGQLIKVWPSTREAGRNGYDQSAVAHCCKGEGWGADQHTYKGFKWLWLSGQKKQKEEANIEQLASS